MMFIIFADALVGMLTATPRLARAVRAIIAECFDMYVSRALRGPIHEICHDALASG